MSNDIRSQINVVFSVITPITEDGTYILDYIFDTSGVLSSSFSPVGVYYGDGVYSLRFDESDTGVDNWSEIPPERIIGFAIIDQVDTVLELDLPKCGILSSKRYVRPKIIAENVTVGILGIGVQSVWTDDIVPEV